MRVEIFISLIIYIEDRLEDEISVNRVVSYSGYSRSAVYNLFVEFCSMSPGVYIRSRKLCRAANLLRLTSMTCIQIAILLGFSTPQSFSREFKRFLGVSPRYYRNSDTWDLSNLVLPIHLRKTMLCENVNYKVISSFDLTLNVIQKKRTEVVLPNRGDNRDLVWLYSIMSIMNGYDYYLASSVEVIPGGVYSFMLNSQIGPAVDKEHKKERGGEIVTVASGMYLKYSFLGTYEEYKELPTNISFFLLPQLGLVRRTGMDIERLVKMGTNSYTVQCEYYMPVSRRGLH